MLMNIKHIDIQNQYNQGERDFQKLQLRRVDLRNHKLQGVNLAGADLSYADLRDVDLSNANLSNCYFNEANLSGANLRGANLQGAYLIKAYLTNVCLKKAILKEAYFTGSFLTKADLTQADLSGTFFNSVHVSGAIFKKATYDNMTRFDKSFDPNILGMEITSSLTKTAAKKISIGDLITHFESIVTITSNYLGGKVTAKNFEESRPDIEWLQNFTIDQKGKISFTGMMNNQATIIQLKWFEKWTNTFIKKCSIIIQDLPDIIEQKNLKVDSFIKKSVAS